MICTAKQWSKVMGSQRNQYNGSLYNVNKYIRLGDDIDLSGESWESRTLTTCLDGDGYALSGISQPLFSVLNGTVKNLILSNVTITGDGEHVGAVARTVGNNSQIENCYISGSLATTGNCAAGGLIGQVQSGALTIQNCIVNADIKNQGSVNDSLAGGLVGSVRVVSGSQLNIKNCIAMGSVSTNLGRGTGGLVGGPNKTVTINKSVALQETIATNSLGYYVNRIFGYTGDYVQGEGNYAYKDMTLTFASGSKKIEKPYPLYYGEDVSKTALLTSNFWKKTLGWGESNWDIREGHFPELKCGETTIFSEDDLPDYLQATNSLKGSVKSGGTGIEGVEITFKKGSSEKKATTEPDGTFSIDLADGTYTVTIKKTGYFTVEKKVTISDADSEALNFTMVTNPVSMLSGQTVTGTFRTTDADTVTADGEIKLTYAGTDSLQPNDFTLSSEKDGTAYDGVTLLAVTTENGTSSIKIQFAKSLKLGNTNEKQLYVHYKKSLIGSIVLKKEVNLVQLAAPADVKWDETVKGKAVWSPVANASGYKVQLLSLIHI